MNDKLSKVLNFVLLLTLCFQLLQSQPIAKIFSFFGGGGFGGPVYVANFDVMGRINQMLQEKIVGGRLDISNMKLENIFGEVGDMKNGLFQFWQKYLDRVKQLGELFVDKLLSLFKTDFDFGKTDVFFPKGDAQKVVVPEGGSAPPEDKIPFIGGALASDESKNQWMEFAKNPKNAATPSVADAEKDPDKYIEKIREIILMMGYPGEYQTVKNSEALTQADKDYWGRIYTYYYFIQSGLQNMTQSGGMGVKRATEIQKDLQDNVIPRIQQSLQDPEYTAFQAQKDQLLLMAYLLVVQTEALKQLSDLKVNLAPVLSQQSKESVEKANAQAIVEVIEKTNDQNKLKPLKKYYQRLGVQFDNNQSTEQSTESTRGNKQ